MQSAITISLVPQAKGGPFVFCDGLADGCRRAAELGFDAVEIFPPSATAIDGDELRKLLAAHKLRVAAVGTGAGWVIHKLSLTHGDVEVRKRAIAFIEALIDLAARFEAPVIIGSMQGRYEGSVSPEQAKTWLAEGLVGLGHRAEAKGQMLLYEPLNRYETNLFNRLSEVVPFLENLKASAVRILADLFHLSIEEASVAEALRSAGHHVGHVHFADSNRQAMGFGHTELPPIIAALRDIGYQGYLSAEVLPLPDSETAARQTMKSFRQYAL
jgi:sugar phosphate isomerase/epimerase